MWIMYNNRAGRLTVVSVFEDSFTGAALFPRSSCRQHSSWWLYSSCNQLLSWAANKAKNCSCFFQIWTLQGIKFWNMNKSFILLIALKVVEVWNASHNWNKDFDTLLSKYVWNYRRKFDILRRVPPTLLSRTPWVFWEKKISKQISLEISYLHLLFCPPIESKMSTTKTDEVASSLGRGSIFDCIMRWKSTERLLLLLPLLLKGELLRVLLLPPTLPFQGGREWWKSPASLTKPQKVPPHQACIPVQITSKTFT